MEPVAIITGLVGVLYIVGRGPHVISPTVTVDYYRRLCATPGRIRLTGVLILAFVAVPLIVTARQSHAGNGEITIWIEAFGWIVTALTITLIVSPVRWHRYAKSYWDSDPAQIWPHSLLKVSFGFFLCWVACVAL